MDVADFPEHDHSARASGPNDRLQVQPGTKSFQAAAGGCLAHLGWLPPTLLVLVGLFVTNLTIIQMPMNPFPLFAAGAHGLAIVTVVGTWRHQSGFSRALSGLVCIPGAVFFLGNMAEGSRVSWRVDGRQPGFLVSVPPGFLGSFSRTLRLRPDQQGAA